jgi:hypothetical protein
MATMLRVVNPALSATALQNAMDSHRLGLTIIASVTVQPGTLPDPFIDVTSASGGQPGSIIVDPRFWQLSGMTISYPDGSSSTLNGDQTRLLYTLVALTVAFGHETAADGAVIARQCLLPPQS